MSLHSVEKLQEAADAAYDKAYLIAEKDLKEKNMMANPYHTNTVESTAVEAYLSTQFCNDFMQGQRDCRNGKAHVEGSSVEYSRGYECQYEAEQVLTWLGVGK